MKFTNPSTYSAAARSIMELRNLRKVKLFPRVSAVTVVTYYRNHDAADDYAGSAYIFNWHHGLQRVSTIHNQHDPPVETEEANEADEDVTAPIGFRQLHHLTT